MNFKLIRYSKLIHDSFSRLCVWYISGVFRAVMTDLVPHRIHSYRVQTDGHSSLGYTFRHPGNEANRSASFLVYGDLGKVGGKFSVLEQQFLSTVLLTSMFPVCVLFGLIYC